MLNFLIFVVIILILKLISVLLVVKIMRKFNIFLLTSFIFCLFSGSLRAQTGSFYSTDNVLSNSLINNIYQDSRNFIWIATEDGLNRYDGVRFNV